MTAVMLMEQHTVRLLQWRWRRIGREGGKGTGRRRREDRGGGPEEMGRERREERGRERRVEERRGMEEGKSGGGGKGDLWQHSLVLTLTQHHTGIHVQIINFTTVHYWTTFDWIRNIFSPTHTIIDVIRKFVCLVGDRWNCTIITRYFISSWVSVLRSCQTSSMDILIMSTPSFFTVMLLVKFYWHFQVKVSNVID